MSAIQAEAIEVSVNDPAASAAKIITAIPVGQGLILESPLGDQIGIWRSGEDAIELEYGGSKLKGTLLLATRAVARFLDVSMNRVKALDTIARAVEKTLGVKLTTPGMAQAPAAGGFRN